MTTSKTVDADVYVGGPSVLTEITDILEVTIAPANSITNEARLGSRDEEASIHSAGVTVSLSSMYDGAQTDALRMAQGQERVFALVSDAGWEVYPIEVPGMPKNASQTEPLTTELSMGQSGRGMYGLGRGADVNTSDSTTLDLSGGNELYLIVTAVTGNPTGITLGKSTDIVSVPARVGIHKLTVPADGAASDSAFTLTGGSSPSLTGVALIGTEQPLAADAV